MFILVNPALNPGPCPRWTATFLQIRKTGGNAWGLVKGSLSETQFCNGHVSELPEVEFRRADLVAGVVERSIGGHWYAVY